MPEIAEVHRVVHFLRRHLVNRKVKQVLTQEDDIVYGKVGCSASAFKKEITGKIVLDVKQQGKYFWLVMSSPPHPLMHLGMTGWVIFSNDDSAYYRKRKLDATEWPPKYWKFSLEMDGKPECKVAFIDARRLARIRLIDAPAAEMRQTSPLKENGPDPMVDKDIFTKEWFRALLRRKKVPVKALLLNQANISGIGNWVADEVLYQARIHPEQYSNTFSDVEMDRIHQSIMDVCTTACEALADSTKFPKDWLMRYRWGKGRKDDPRLPNGHSISFVTVGGRTSAVIEALQKKTGPVPDNLKVENPAEVSDSPEIELPSIPVKKSRKRKAASDQDTPQGTTGTKPSEEKKRKRANSVKIEETTVPIQNGSSEGRRRSTRRSTQPDTSQNTSRKNEDATPIAKKKMIATASKTKPTGKAGRKASSKG